MNFEVTTTRTGIRSIKLARINVFLGANGTGKSKLLQEIRSSINNFLPDYDILNIEGGRALQMYDSLVLDRQNFNNYKTYEQTYSGYQKKRQGTLHSRLFDGLKTLEQLAESQKIEHSDSVTEWLDGDLTTIDPDNVPRRLVDPMARVFETFSDIFPSISLKYYQADKRLRCKKNGTRYGPTSLSDGEKQVFSILVDVVELADKKTVLFVDEPELNLHPGLANRLWASVESLLPDSVFIYATHSVSFAMRETVDSLLVLSDTDENIQELDNLDDLTIREKEDLLGNITSLISNKKTLLVEGHDESFDSIFYNWLLGDKEISPAAVGGCDDVLAIMARSGKWSHISPNVTLAGVIDRDYKGETALTNVEKAGVIALSFHEAESYLCDPEVLTEIAKAVGTVQSLPSEKVLIAKICSFVSSIQLKIVARRVAAQLNVRVGVSVPAKALARINSEAQLKQLLIADVIRQKTHVSESLDEKVVEGLIAKETEALRNGINNQDIGSLLTLAPGKELLAILAPLAGCVDANGIARAARHHLRADKYSSLASLRDQILATFDDGSETDSEIDSEVSEPS